MNTTNANAGATAAASHLTFNGPASGTATVSVSSFQIGAGSDKTNGSSVTFDGPGLIVTNATGTNGATVVGRVSNDNLLSVRNGADVTLYALWISNSTPTLQGYKDNRTVVDNASLTINGGGGNTGLYIGSLPGAGTPRAGYADGAQNNSLSITNNGKLTVTTGKGGSSAGEIQIGSTTQAHSNFLSIASGGEMMVSSKNTIRIGDNSDLNLGGNRLEIAQDGTLRTNGNIVINGYNANGTNDGNNRLLIRSGGKLLSSGTISVKGLLQLDEGGMLNGKNLDNTDGNLTLNIEANGTLQAGGSGLGKNVVTTIKGGALNVGNGTAATTLTLQSTVTYANAPGTLGLSLFSNGVSDVLNLTTEGHLALNNTKLLLTLKNYTPELGDAWTLFTGETGNITGIFDLASLPQLSGGLYWDTSAVNQAGEWRLAVIPEANAVVMSVIGFSCMFLFGVAKRRYNTTLA